MIKCDKGIIELEGKGHELLSELSTLVHYLYTTVMVENNGIDPEEAKDAILDSVELGFKTEAELEDKIASEMHSIIDNVICMLENLVKGREH